MNEMLPIDESLPLFDKPTDDQADDTAFKIGLVMAGAISAGAYTAGVMDFMIEALQCWEAEKKRLRDAGETDSNIPMHDVQFDVLAGASAGGMCAGIFASALRNYKKGTTSQNPDKDAKSSFYQSWVLNVDYKAMMQDDDLKNDPTPRSLFNVQGEEGLEGIRDKALNISAPTEAPWPKWLKDPLPILLSINNLRGIPYSLSFSGELSGANHGMSNHKDFALFSLTDTNNNGGRKFLDSITLSYRTNGIDDNWRFFGDALLATGAFPAAFPPRLLKRDASLYARRKFSVPGDDGKSLNWQKIRNVWGEMPPEDYAHYTVDGGTLNNEPMDLARKALADKTGRNSRDSKVATRMILMVDPFPNPIDDQENWQNHGSLGGSLSQLLTSYKSQARFKIEDLMLFGDIATASRFSIAPKSADPDRSTPLVCASLGAFGGILDEEWRHHDYLLGRLNCQQFLRKWFVVHKSHRLLAQNNLPEDAEEMQAIIPLVAGMEKPDAAIEGIAEQDFILNWPNAWTDRRFNLFFNPLKKRLNKVLKAQLKMAKQSEIDKTEANKNTVPAKWWQLGRHLKNSTNFLKRKTKNSISHVKWGAVGAYISLPRILFANGAIRDFIAEDLGRRILYTGKYYDSKKDAK